MGEKDGMSRIFWLILGLALAACGGDAARGGDERLVTLDPEARHLLPQPKAYVRRKDRDAARRLHSGLAAPAPCADLFAQHVIEMDRCYRFGPPQRFNGLWAAGFELSRFCAPPAKECSHFAPPGNETWIEGAGKYLAPEDQRRDGLFAVDFIGRRSMYPGTYGHSNQYEHAIIVERMLSIRRVAEHPGKAVKM